MTVLAAAGSTASWHGCVWETTVCADTRTHSRPCGVSGHGCVHVSVPMETARCVCACAYERVRRWVCCPGLSGKDTCPAVLPGGRAGTRLSSETSQLCPPPAASAPCATRAMGMSGDQTAGRSDLPSQREAALLRRGWRGGRKPGSAERGWEPAGCGRQRQCGCSRGREQKPPGEEGISDQGH